MKALVTGATGFIGSVLTGKLLSQGHGVRALVLPGEDASALEKRGAETVRGDLTDPGSLAGICAGMDAVFHLAGRVVNGGTRRMFHAAIYTATDNLIKEAAGRVPRFVYVSSIAAMGMGRHLKGVKETDPTRRSGAAYNDEKADAEKLVMGYHDAGAISCTVVRPANVVGPGSVWVRDVVGRMMASFVPLIDGGRHSASLVYVENLAEGMVLAGTKDVAKGKAYHFRDDWTVTWKQYITDLGSFVGKKPLGSIPFRAAWIAGGIMDAVLNPLHIDPPLSRMAAGVMGRDNDVDTALARTELGWRTKVSYPEAMEKIGAWVREKYGKK